MLRPADILTVKPVGHVDPLGGLDRVTDPRQEAFQRSLAGMLGKSMQAEVLSKLSDGSFLVKVAGTSARMMLPAGVEVGSEVPMTLIATGPRPTFQIATGSGQSIQHALPAPAGPAPGAAAPQPSPPGAAPGLAGPALSLAAALSPAGAAPGPAAAALGPVGASPGPVAAAPGPLAPPPGSAGAAPGAGFGPASAAPGQAGPAPGLAAALPSPAATLLGKAPLTPAGLLPELDPATPSASLSAAARLIASVLTTARSVPGGLNALAGSAPLIEGAAPDPAQLAQKLQQTLAQSGLFYESHLAEWAEGKRPLSELMREPQMQRAPGAPATDPDTAQFINLQLTSQEQGRVAWQGQLAAGQPMQWEIHKDAPERRGADGAPAQPAWRSGMRLRFALLGEIAATVTMTGGQLHIQLLAGAGEAASLLSAHAGALAAAMEAAGTPLSSLNIGVGQAAPDA